MCIAFHKSRHKYSLDIPFACLRMEMQPGGVSVRSETELLHPNEPVFFFLAGLSCEAEDVCISYNNWTAYVYWDCSHVSSLSVAHAVIMKKW